MTIFRVSHNKNYTVINNTICTDNRLSWKAKGIWLYAFSRPDDWHFYICDLINQSTDGRDSVSAGLKELQNAGYLVRKRHRNEKGHLGNADWTFHETPQEIDLSDDFEPKPENPMLDNPTLGNPSLPSTDLKPSIDKQQTTTEPAAAAAAQINIFSCLKTVDIPGKEKEWLCQNYSEQQIKSAIAWSRLPTTKINKTLAAALKWACENKMGISQDSVEITMEHDHRKHAQKLEMTIHSDNYRFLALDNHCEVIGNDEVKPTEFDYKDPDFYQNLARYLSKKGFIKM